MVLCWVCLVFLVFKLIFGVDDVLGLWDGLCDLVVGLGEVCEIDVMLDVVSDVVLCDKLMVV